MQHVFRFALKCVHLSVLRVQFILSGNVYKLFSFYSSRNLNPRPDTGTHGTRALFLPKSLIQSFDSRSPARTLSIRAFFSGSRHSGFWGRRAFRRDELTDYVKRRLGESPSQRART